MTKTATDYTNFGSDILSAQLEPQYQKRILIIVSIMGILVSLTYSSILWVVYENILSSLTDFAYAFAYLWTLRWVKQEKYTQSAYWLILWAGIQVSTGTIFFVGPETGFQLYFLTLPVIMYFLLSGQSLIAKAATLAYGCVCFIASHTIHVYSYRAPIAEGIADLIFIANGLVVFTMICFVVKFFKDEIEHAYREQSKLVLTDSLTGLANHRFVELHAQKLLSLCDRYGHPFSLIRFDIDHFSELNTNYGRPLADECLRQLGKLVLDNLRDADILARTGGDEFVVLLPETQIEAAEEVVRRLSLELKNHRFSAKDKALVLTASFGTSFCDSSEMSSINELIEAANLALKEEKNPIKHEMSQTDTSPD